MTGFQLEGNAAERYEQFVAPIMAPFVHALIEAAHISSGDRVLDVACGTGFVARAATELTDQVSGADVNAGMLAVARSHAPAITFVEAPADALPFEDNTFNAVVCQQGLQFFPDPDAALAEFARVTKPGGHIAATTWGPYARSPYFAAQRAAFNELLGEEVAASYDGAFGMTAERLSATFNSAGLRDVTVTDVAADITLTDLRSFAEGQCASLPWGAQAAAARPDGIQAAAKIIVENLGELVADDAVTVPFVSNLAVGVR